MSNSVELHINKGEKLKILDFFNLQNLTNTIPVGTESGASPRLTPGLRGIFRGPRSSSVRAASPYSLLRERYF